MHTANRSGQGGGPEAVGSGLKPGPREVQVKGVYTRTEPQTGATYCGQGLCDGFCCPRPNIVPFDGWKHRGPESLWQQTSSLHSEGTTEGTRDRKLKLKIQGGL